MNRYHAFVGVIALATGSAQASLLGTELGIGAINQVSASSEIFTSDFPAAVIVSEEAVEFPSAESLFGDEPRPPGSFVVDTSIDAMADAIEVDFDNASSGSFANWLQNTYVFTFSSAALVNITGATVDRDVTTLAVSDDAVTFAGDQLFVNVSAASYNPSTFLRIDLTSEVTPVIPLPAGLPLLLAGLGALGILRQRGG